MSMNPEIKKKTNPKNKFFSYNAVKPKTAGTSARTVQRFGETPKREKTKPKRILTASVSK
jgi:hypothetical protein